MIDTSGFSGFFLMSTKIFFEKVPFTRSSSLPTHQRAFASPFQSKKTICGTTNFSSRTQLLNRFEIYVNSDTYLGIENA